MTAEAISKAVNIFRESPTSSDHEIYIRVVASGVEPQHAARLVEFLPMAYCCLILTGAGARFSDRFQRRLQDGTLSPERTLASDKEHTGLGALKCRALNSMKEDLARWLGRQ